MDKPTYESRHAELDRIDGLLTEIECHVIFREVARRRPWIRATADVREAARLIIEKHYRLWRQGCEEPLWPWNKLAAANEPYRVQIYLDVAGHGISAPGAREKMKKDATCGRSGRTWTGRRRPN
jgi:hypothetical protein